MTVYEKIEAQQKGIEGSAAWMVGEQLKEICSEEPGYAELVLQDLENKDMSIQAAERKIKEYADKQKKTGNCVCVPPNVAERIIREFYGLPCMENASHKTSASVLKLVPQETNAELKTFDLSEFI